MSSQPLSEEESESLREVVGNKLRARFPDSPRWYKAAADAVGVDQPTINRLMNGKSKGSLTLAKKVADYLNLSVWEVIGFHDAPTTRHIRDLTGYRDALREAKSLARAANATISAATWTRVGDVSMTPPRPPNGHVLFGLAVEIQRQLDESGSL